MRIEPKVTGPVTLPDARDPKTQPDKTTPASVVELSPAGAAASKAHTPASPERLAAIRASIRDGAYPVDLDKLASRILDDELVRGVNE